MFVKRHGSGRDHFLCLHGWSGTHRTFDPLVPFVPHRASLFAVDLPGCGSSEPPEQWKLASVSGEVAGAIDEIGGPVTLVGNCIGALLGMRAALDRPEAVRRLVLIDAFAQWPWYFRVFTAPGWGHYAYASTFANPIGRRLTNRALARRRSAESNLTEGFADVRHDVALQYLHVLREIGGAGDFAGLRMPTDVVFGARTFRAVRESAEIWQSMWPWARVHELAGTGHLPIREASAELSQLIFQGDACQPESATTSNSTAR